jgi:hypothetical protein
MTEQVPRLDPVLCPHCEEVTAPNLLADGSYVCSCTAERPLPLGTAQDTPWDGQRGGSMPAPMDDGDVDPSRGTLPADKGQFGRDVETEDYQPLGRPPGQ